MGDNIAVSKKKQKSFQSSVDNYKKLLKSGDLEVDENATGQEISDKKKARGIVYLSNIPHGFYEEQMREYFKQFGHVTRIRLARSKNTGKSKGFAFIEFKVPEVAQVVAETMNNYLMLKRLIKAKYIPPEEQHEYYFKGKNWTENLYPKVMNRKKNLVRENKNKTDKKVLDFAKKQLKELEKIKKKLLEVGIIYNFEPIDIPEGLTLNYNQKNISVNDISDNESENAPILFLHESDDSDIVINAPSDYKTVVVTKKNENSPSPKQKKLKKKKSNIDEKKSGGIFKKNKKARPLLLNNKNNKKLELIKNSLNDDKQVKLRKKKN